MKNYEQKNLEFRSSNLYLYITIESRILEKDGSFQDKSIGLVSSTEFEKLSKVQIQNLVLFIFIIAPLDPLNFISFLQQLNIRSLQLIL